MKKEQRNKGLKYGNPAPKTKRLIDADKMRLYGIMPERYNDTVTCSDKEYETQHDMLQVTRMSMSDDNNRHSRLTNNADFSIDEIGGIYTIQQPQHLPNQNNVSPRTDMLSRPKLQSRIYIPPPDYPPNVSSKKVGDKRETLTIL
uniref:Uncharacterized protein n=1 Tax=Romanomermis culicivorax TaxID=13658 RepID=A0A915JUD1_ROMCU